MASLTLTIDCSDPDRLADFWCAAIGYVRSGAMGQYRAISPGSDPRFRRGPKILFQTVPEPKIGKNRLHLDLDLDPGIPLEPEVKRLMALGARIAGSPVDEFGLTWQTLLDPEGNELCVVARPERS